MFGGTVVLFMHEATGIQRIPRILHHFFCAMAVYVQSCGNVSVTKQILDNLDADARICCKIRCKSMTQGMTAEMGEQNSRCVRFQKLLIVAVTDDALKCFVQDILLQRRTESVEKYKIRVAVHS